MSGQNLKVDTRDCSTRSNDNCWQIEEVFDIEGIPMMHSSPKKTKTHDKIEDIIPRLSRFPAVSGQLYRVFGHILDDFNANLVRLKGNPRLPQKDGLI